MMYATEEEFLVDFVMRTKENIKYCSKSPYEVTQLINSMIGLLVVPKEKYDNLISDDLISQELLHKMLSCVEFDSYYDKGTLKGFVRHLRNAISHSKFDFKAERQPMYDAPLLIHSVTFEDHRKKDGIISDFKAGIPLDLLKEFLFDFSDALAIKAAKQKESRKVRRK